MVSVGDELLTPASHSRDRLERLDILLFVHDDSLWRNDATFAIGILEAIAPSAKCFSRERQNLAAKEAC